MLGGAILESWLYNYRITPRVVKKGCFTTVSVEGLDDCSRFYDSLEYEVSITERDGYVFSEGFSIPPKIDTEGKAFKAKS